MKKIVPLFSILLSVTVMLSTVGCGGLPSVGTGSFVVGGAPVAVNQNFLYSFSQTTSNKDSKGNTTFRVSFLFLNDQDALNNLTDIDTTRPAGEYLYLTVNLPSATSFKPGFVTIDNPEKKGASNTLAYAELSIGGGTTVGVSYSGIASSGSIEFTNTGLNTDYSVSFADGSYSLTFDSANSFNGTFSVTY